MASSPLSVLMALDSLNAGGTETHVLSIAEELIRKGQKVILISADGPMRMRFENAGCTIFLFDFQRSDKAAQIEHVDKLKKILRSQKINCVHVHQTPSGLVAASAAAGLRIPIVFTAHGTYYPLNILKKLLLYSNAVISVSRPIQSYLKRLGYSSSVIPNGIDLLEFYPSKATNLRTDLGISNDAVVLMYASRLAWGKASACDVLLRAMKDLYHYGWHKLELIVVGDGPQYKAIVELAQFIESESGRAFIHVLGSQTEMWKYYNAADIVIGTGRVALEAMACEKPVLAIGNHGFFGWVAPDNYEQAWLDYFGDHGSSAPYSRYLFSNEIAQGCRELDRLRTYGLEGRRWVEREFSIDRTVEQTLKVYRSVRSKG